MRQLKRIAIAEHTLAAVDSGRYVNARDEVVDIAAAVEAAVAGTVLHESRPRTAPANRFATRTTVTGESTIEALVRPKF